MKARCAAMLVAILLAAGCSKVENEPAVDPVPQPETAAEAVAGGDAAVAMALLDRGDVPAAIEPLSRAVAEKRPPANTNQEELELLLAQARAATNDEFVEQRIGDLKDAQIEAFAEKGELPTVPYFHDPRIDAYFRKVLMTKQSEAREIRERVRAERRKR